MRAPRTRTFGAPRSHSTSSRKSVGMFRRPSMPALTTAVFTSSATKSPATTRMAATTAPGSGGSRSTRTSGACRSSAIPAYAGRWDSQAPAPSASTSRALKSSFSARSSEARCSRGSAVETVRRSMDPSCWVRGHCRRGGRAGDGKAAPQGSVTVVPAAPGFEDPRAAHAHIHQPGEERMRALPHFHHQIAHHPLVLTGGKRRGAALQPLCQFRVRELDPRACLAAVSDVDPAEDGSAQRAHLLAVRQRELDHDPVPAHQPRCHFTEEEERPSLDYVQVALQMGKVREAHLEQVGVPLHAGSLRPACGASRFRPATGASAYMRYPTTAWTVKARSAPVPDILMNRCPNLGFSPTISLRSIAYSPASPNWGPTSKNRVCVPLMAMARSAAAARRSSGVAWTPTTPPTGKRVMKSVPPLCE